MIEMRSFTCLSCRLPFTETPTFRDKLTPVARPRCPYCGRKTLVPSAEAKTT